ncbi:hypothetical protein HGRIS_007426 [Hohenbuehelia grisea]
MAALAPTDNIHRELDVLIVGTGLSGVYQLYQMRKRGLDVLAFEDGGDLGGVWYWNRYPGARVDSQHSIYQLTPEELWKDWSWSERFPASSELREYFRYVDEKLDLKRDIHFNTRVVAAEFDEGANRWIVRTHDGKIVRPRILSLCTGFASKKYLPPFKGLDSFKGVYHHSAQWPHGGVDLRGKRVGVIGTGASGVQIIQEAGPEAGHLTVFQRTANIALPMRQKKLDRSPQKLDDTFPNIFALRFEGCLDRSIMQLYIPHNTFDVSAEERRAAYEKLWDYGAAAFWVSNFKDILTSEEANNEAYAFWREKTRARLNDPGMQAKLAPDIPPHPIGVKRPCLEDTYFEVYNQPNVTLVDLSEQPIDEIVPSGVKTADGTVHELDVLVVATGFDALTGGMTQIDIKGPNGKTLKSKWDEGVKTNLGVATADFPNMFFVYGPHGPTAFTNGPTAIEMQSDWVVNCVDHMKRNDLSRIDVEPKAETEWTALVHELSSGALWKRAKSWYMGANIPGKPVEPLNFTGGVNMYNNELKRSAENDYEGFVLRKS